MANLERRAGLLAATTMALSFSAALFVEGMVGWDEGGKKIKEIRNSPALSLPEVKKGVDSIARDRVFASIEMFTAVGVPVLVIIAVHTIYKRREEIAAQEKSGEPPQISA